jgi:hypothetical protein
VNATASLIPIPLPGRDLSPDNGRFIDPPIQMRVIKIINTPLIRIIDGHP